MFLHIYVPESIHFISQHIKAIMNGQFSHEDIVLAIARLSHRRMLSLGCLTEKEENDTVSVEK